MKLFVFVIFLLYLSCVRGDDIILSYDIYRSVVDQASRDSKTTALLLPVLVGFKMAGTLLMALFMTTIFTIKSVLTAKVAISAILAVIFKKLRLLYADNHTSHFDYFDNDYKSKYHYNNYPGMLSEQYYFLNDNGLEEVEFKPDTYHDNHDNRLTHDYLIESENRHRNVPVITTSSSTTVSSTSNKTRRRSDYSYYPSRNNNKKHS